MSEVHDLGSGVTYTKFGWFPERDLNPQYEEIPDVEWAGILITFPDGCRGAVNFDDPVMRQVNPNGTFWTVVLFDPLTLNPSIRLMAPACPQGTDHHGFIQQGRWVAA